MLAVCIDADLLTNVQSVVIFKTITASLSPQHSVIMSDKYIRISDKLCTLTAFAIYVGLWLLSKLEKSSGSA
jgi:hypothetical protein